MGMFCPSCRSLMYPNKDGELECKKCKTTSKDEGGLTITTEEVEKEMAVFDDVGGTLPTTDIRCPNCENTTAEWQTRQMRAADEAPTRIYRCTSCRHTWREND